MNFVVVGGGPTGVEMAGQIAELAHRALKNNYRSFDPAQARIVLLEVIFAALVSRLHGEVQRALKLPEVDGSFSTQGMEPTSSPQPEFAGFVAAELRKYAVLIKESGAAEN